MKKLLAVTLLGLVASNAMALSCTNTTQHGLHKDIYITSQNAKVECTNDKNYADNVQIALNFYQNNPTMATNPGENVAIQCGSISLTKAIPFSGIMDLCKLKPKQTLTITYNAYGDKNVYLSGQLQAWKDVL